ncbi:hypothetical protein [Pseudarthrobacter sp. H2]|uniref:hypothetical protein n=1 Tax=Pseudarthrobacter sp. H2 TaxID=3418415 RepID=UPI003CF215AF
MNAMRGLRPRSHNVPALAGRSRDFIAVDDSGDFTYHRSEQDLLTAFEYVEEARTVLDRDGTDYRLALDPNRHIVLGPALGPVEFHWLRQAWQVAQKMHIEEHRIRRFFADTGDQLLRDLFETLVLEHGAGSATDSWTVDIESTPTHLDNLEEVDRRLSGPVRLEQARVEDPFGRTYRPVRHRNHWYLPAAAGFIVYIEIPPHNGARRAPGRRAAA